MHDRLRLKIALLTTLTCWDHYKTKDGIYEIRYHYDAWSEKGTWVIEHAGYLWEVCKDGFGNYAAAEAALEDAVDAQWKKELAWFYDNVDKPDGYFDFDLKARLQTVKDLEHEWPR